MKISKPETKDAFSGLVDDIWASDMYRKPILYAIGGEVRTADGLLASVRYPVVNGGGNPNFGTAAILLNFLKIRKDSGPVVTVKLSRLELKEILTWFAPFQNDGKVHHNLEALRAALRSVHDDRVSITFIFDDVPPEGVEDATLKLYALSNRLFKPNTLNVSKIFGVLPNVAWVNGVPYSEARVNTSIMDAAFGFALFTPELVDKFPRYTDCINALKMGVRITDPNKVRLGAYLGEGTTVMPGASYINFNAGTEGPAMVEGRISSSAFIGAGTDIGGGASMLGTLSGGNKTPISTGRNCLLEVNSTLGIPVGDATIIAANTAVLASSLVRVNFEKHAKYGHNVKAKELSGISGVTFRRNDVNGVLEVIRTRRNEEFARKLADGETILSADLHKN